jgi:hypothetical protein
LMTRALLLSLPMEMRGSTSHMEGCLLSRN